MTELRLRDAVAGDLPAIVAFNLAMALESEALRLDPELLSRGVEAVLRDQSKGFYLVAEQDGRPVGQLMVTEEWSDWRNCMWWWLQSVYVVPEARRSGIFRALFNETLERARQSGARGLRLYVEKDNAVAQRTYAALGMTEGRYRFFELGEE